MFIYKYEFVIDDRTTLNLPIGSKILTVGWQGKKYGNYPIICIWAMVDPNLETEPRTFKVFGTGHEMAIKGEMEYIGSVFQENFVWHVFEEK